MKIGISLPFILLNRKGEERKAVWTACKLGP